MTALEEFKSSLRGYLLRPGDTAYDEARKLWNGMFDRRPAVLSAVPGRPMLLPPCLRRG